MKCSQLMKCIFCYVNLILIINSKIQARKGLILYNSTIGIKTLKKHVYANHCEIAKIFEEEINNLSKDPLKKNLQKKRPYINGTIIFNFFATKDSYLKNDVQQK